METVYIITIGAAILAFIAGFGLGVIIMGVQDGTFKD